MRTLCLLLLAGLWPMLPTAVAAPASTSVTNLRCEFRTEPLGVDSPAPRLFWMLESAARGQRQTAYQVLAASSKELLARDSGDLWDSGKVMSDASAHVPYGGKAPASSQQLFWKVRVWDKDGQATGWSAAASWTMGLLNDADWKGRWIGANPAKAATRKSIGYHAGETPREDDLKWVQVDLGRSTPLQAIRLQPMDHAGKKGFGFPVRFKVELSEDPDFQKPISIADHAEADYPNPGVQPVAFDVKEASARYVRVTVTKIWNRDTSYCFALCQLEAIDKAGTNIAIGAPVTCKDTVEAHGWGKDGLTDGLCGGEPREPDPQTLILRREFVVKPGLRRAVAHVCGLGYYEFSVNGAKAGDALFPPGWTKYDKTCLYDTYDVTGMLRDGPNAVGLLLGNGMYNVVGGRYIKFKGSFGPLKAIGQIQLDYLDGSTEIVGTDDRWTLTPGPITFSCIYGGEDYDARREAHGWNQAGFDDSNWKAALLVDGPGGKLKGLSCAAPPIRAFETLKPVKVTQIRPGITVYDLGQNASLIPQLKTRGVPGSSVRIIPAELVAADGTVDRRSCGGGAAYWQYTLAGKGTEEWFPKFFYHGSRYLQVELKAPEGAPLPVVESLQGVVVHADSEAVGEFECSNDLFNRIRKLVRWAQRSNMMSVMTDCPHREKLGWLEEDHLNGPSLRYEFNLANLFAKLMNDMADSQLPNGLVPDIAPEYVQFSGGFRDSPEWGSACILVPWQQYEFTGDIELLRHYFDRMKAYVAYLGSRAENHIVSHGLGDWYDIGPKPPGVAQLTPIPVTATAFYYMDALVVSRAAELLGKTEDAQHYARLASDIRTAFIKHFLNRETGQIATGSQAANSIALVMGLVEPEFRHALLTNVVTDVRNRGNALTAGDVGYRYLLRALADGGRSDVIFDINNQSEKPGYGYQLKQGATSLTEAWDAGRGSSHNHFMLGQINEWFYHDLAGIQPDLERPGFKRVIIKPALAGTVSWVRASHRSPYGTIAVDWRRIDGGLHLKVSVPVNTSAYVYVPCDKTNGLTENGVPATRSAGVRLLSQSAGCAVFDVGSGSYEFKSRL